MINTKKLFGKLIVLSSIIVCSVLGIFGLFQKFDMRVYDVLLGMRKDTQTRPEVLLIDIDDASLEAMGPWPWSRDILGNTLIRMKELGAKTAVFDIEYLSPSNLSVNPKSDAIIQNAFANATYDTTPESFYESLKNQIFLNNDDYFARSVQFFGNAWLTINAQDLAINYSEEDLNYARTRFLFNVEDTENLVEKGNLYTAFEDDRFSIFDRFALHKIDFLNKDELLPYNEYVSGFTPAIHDFIKMAKGAGFTNSFIDSDGCRRRVELLAKKGDKYLGQLSFAPLLNFLNVKQIIRNKRTVELIDAEIPDRESGLFEKVNISIPVDEFGRMFVNWKHASFTDSFRHVSVFWITDINNNENNILSVLQNINSFSWPGDEVLSYKAKLTELLSLYSQISVAKDMLLEQCRGFDIDGKAIDGGISQEEYDYYFSMRKTFFESVKAFCSENLLDEIGNYLLENVDLYGQEAVSQVGEWFSEMFDDLSNEIEVYNTTFSRLQKELNGSFCIIGNTASGTTDLGTNPFVRAYPNVGLHANVYNTILTQEFITPINWWWGVAITGILSLLLLGFIPSKKIALQIVSGIFLIFIVVAIPICFMIFKGIYIPSVTSFFIAVLSFLSVTIFRFIIESNEKKYITNAFSQCLAPTVVKQLISNPDSFKLGGETIGMSAIFTDIQKFSSFSELLSAPQLVALLNYYLTRMCNIFMSEGGTIDKFEGDAIVAFIGAPYKMEDHASRICSAALKMKSAEKEMNEEIKKIAALNDEDALNEIDKIFNIDSSVLKNKNKNKDVSDVEKKRYLLEAFRIMVKNKKTIFTRIGINSGEMTAGYMGSDSKKNYTMMGNNVNLASRLEGVNKQYSTAGILISEHTRKDLGDKFIVRSLDRVRVVNVNTPLRLYELVAERSSADEKLLKYMDNWEKIMKIFESGDYAKSLDYLKKLSSNTPSQYPEDKVAAYYIDLIETYFIKGKVPTEKDDAGVAFEEDGVFKLLQK